MSTCLPFRRATRYRHSSIVDFFKLPREINLMLAALVCQVVYLMYELFIRHYPQTYSLLYDVLVLANRMYSRWFTAFLIINCPFNCALITALVASHHTLYTTFLVAATAAQQFIAIFGVHLVIAMLNSRFHKTSKLFIRLYMRCQPQKKKKKKTISGIRIANFIHAFHTDRKYGITYYKMGLISMFAFAKVSGARHISAN